MHTLQMIQQLDAATIVATMLALPWLAVSLMHAVSARETSALDDGWKAHAEAAVRWAKNATPANSVIRFVQRRQVRANEFAAPVLNAA